MQELPNMVCIKIKFGSVQRAAPPSSLCRKIIISGKVGAAQLSITAVSMFVHPHG